MLEKEYPNGLIFPKLNKVDSGYVLDWDGWEERFRHPNPLPFVWEELIRGLVFDIDKDYLEEIKSMAGMANQQWGKQRPFDTMVRDILLGPSIEAAFCAFWLLGDCLPKEEASDYIAANIMLYKFWLPQTGRGLVAHNAQIDEWGDISSGQRNRWTELFDLQKKFCSDVEGR